MVLTSHNLLQLMCFTLSIADLCELCAFFVIFAVKKKITAKAAKVYAENTKERTINNVINMQIINYEK
jgi:hypothetical protein